MVILYLFIWGTSVLSSIVVAPTTFLPRMYEGSLFLHKHLLFGNFDYGHSDQYELIPHIVLACLSLIISDVEQFFIFWGGIWLSSIEKCLFRSSAHFWLGFCFFEISMRCLYILEINCLMVSHLQRFSPILYVVFVLLLMVSFAVWKILNLIRPCWFIFVFIFIILGGR